MPVFEMGLSEPEWVGDGGGLLGLYLGADSRSGLSTADVAALDGVPVHGLVGP